MASGNTSIFRLLKLPAELRIRIFSHLFDDVRVYFSCRSPRTCLFLKWRNTLGEDRTLPCLNITLASKIIRSESMSMFLARATFMISSMHADSMFPIGDSGMSIHPLEQHFWNCLYQVQHVKGMVRLLRFFDITSTNEIKISAVPVGWFINGSLKRMTVVAGLKVVPVGSTSGTLQHHRLCDSVWEYSGDNLDYFIPDDVIQLRKFVTEVKNIELCLTLRVKTNPHPLDSAKSVLLFFNGNAKVLIEPWQPWAREILVELLERVSLGESDAAERLRLKVEPDGRGTHGVVTQQ